jgi:spore germination protein KC
MKVKVEMDAIVQEIDGDQRIFTPDNIIELEKKSEKLIIAEINNLVSLCQKQYRVDVFGLGNKVEYKHPRLWKNIKDDWINEFAKAVPEIQLDLKITGSDRSMEVPEEGE